MHRVWTWTAIGLSVGLLSITTEAWAQPTPADLTPGARVRITAPSVATSPLVGTLLRLEADRVLLRPNEHSAPIAVPLHAVEQIDVSRGRRSAALSGLVKGTATGAIAGGLLWVGMRDCDGPCTDITLGKVAFAGAFLGGVVGLVAGSLHRSDKWEPVSATRLRVAVVPVERGLGLAAVLRF